MSAERRIVVLTAAVTALVVMIASCVVWVLWTQAAAQEGTVGKLEKASTVGRWTPVQADPLLAGRAVAAGETVVVGGFDEVDRIAAGTRSWLVQVTATSSGPANVWLAGDTASAEAMPTLTLPGGTGSVSSLVDVGDDGEVTVLADAGVLVTLTVVAAFTGTGDEMPGPGGTRAVSPVAAFSASTSAGQAVPSTAEPAWISPAGLGEVPSVGGVAGAWLHIRANGAAGSVMVGPSDGLVPVASLDQGFASVLVPAPTDADGRIWVAADGQVEGLSVEIVGWTAGADRAADATVVEGGLALGVPSAVTTDDPTPADVVDLYVVSSSAETRLTGTGSLDGRDITPVPVAGTGHTVIASDEPLSDAAVSAPAVWLGQFAAPQDDDGTVEITIDSPEQDADIDLAEAGGVVTFSGRVTGTTSLRSVVLTLGNRYIGSAAVVPTANGWSWSLRTSATPGAHTVTARVVDYAGHDDADAVAIDLAAPQSEATTVIADNTVVGGQDFSAQVAAATDNTITLTGQADLVVGDIVVIEPSDQLPDGRMAHVTALRQVDGRAMEITTRPATLDEIFLQVDYQQLAIPLTEQTSGTSTSYRVDGDQSPVVPPPPGGGASAAVDVPRGLDFDDSFEIARLRFDGKFTGTAAYAKKKVDAKTTSELSFFVNDESVFDGQWESQWHKDVSGPERSEAAANLTAALEATFVVTVNVTMRTSVHLAWFEAPKVTINHLEITQTQTFDESFTFNTTGNFDHGIDEDLAAAEPAARAKSLKEQADEAAQASKDDRTVKLGTARFSIHVVPVFINFYATVNAGFGAHISGEASVTQLFGFTHETGFAYETGAFREIDDFRITKESQEASFRVDAVASAVLFDNFRAMIYDVSGPTADLGLMVELTASAEGEAHNNAETATNPQTDAGASYQAEAALDLYGFGSVGVAIDFLGLDENWKSDEAELFRHRIWEWHSDGCVADSCPDTETDTAGPTDTGAPPDTSAVSQGDRPLVIIMDASGSMAGGRIEEAKSAMHQLLDAQSIGSEIGLFTYPGPASSCDAGNFVVNVEPVTGFSHLLDAVDQITTSGGTPTGEALQEVVDTLEAQGRTGATILLVSDGESNCQVPPCEAAQQAVAKGFEIAVQAIAFNSSEAGRDELACVSGATGGTLYELESADEDELWNLVEDLSLATLEVDVAVPKTVATGSRAEVTVKVTNPSARDVEAARLSVLADSSVGAPSVSPSAQIVLGNLPPGASVTRTVSVTLGAGATGPVDLRVTGWADNVESVEVEDGFEVVERDDLDLTPGKILDGGERAVVLGDGFSGSTGAECPDDLATTNAAAATPKIEGESLACPGATTRDIVDTALADTQVGQVSSSDQETVVHVSAGAEDVGLSELIAHCAEADCDPADSQFVTAVRAAQEIDFARFYALVAQESADRLGRGAPVVVSAYPYVFDEWNGRDCSDEFDGGEVRMMNSLIGTLNAQMSAGAEAAAADGYEVYFASSAAQALRQADATLCSDEPGLTIDKHVELNDIGTAAMGGSLAQWSQGRERSTSATSPAPLDTTSGRHLLSWMFPGDVDLVFDARPVASYAEFDVGSTKDRAAVVKIGQDLHVSGAGYEPNTWVTLTLYQEDTTLLGRFRVGADGVLEARTPVPAGTAVGEAELSLVGVSADGAAERLTMPVQVAAPVGFLPSLLVLLALLAGLALIGLAVRRRFSWRIRELGDRQGETPPA
ncbi:MAG: VWA domain-containing protein [Aeromicrobium sp.]|uniref:VWA domain-containing protein n=1 Tax=Aeromicrobium sp. TaxID=1871063 RepID=UPI0039E5E2FB